MQKGLQIVNYPKILKNYKICNIKPGDTEYVQKLLHQPHSTAYKPTSHGHLRIIWLTVTTNCLPF